MNKFASALLLTALSLAATSATAQLINFDDITDGGTTGTAIPTSYAGFNWDNWSVLNAPAYGASGFLNGLVSTPNVAFNQWGLDATISSPKAFNLVDGYFTSASDTSLQIQVTGTLVGGGSVLQSYTIGTAGPTDIQFNLHNLTSVTFSATDTSNAGGATVFALDNLRINPVPEPEEWAMLMAGIPLVGWQIRRKQKNRAAPVA